MIFGKHINKYYLKYCPLLLLGIMCLIAVDSAQLKIPELYRLVVNGLNDGTVLFNGETVAFDVNFLLGEICSPMLIIICCLLVGRFLWRICFFGAAILVETDLRKRMFDKCKDLSQQFYEENKVGTLMSLFTNDLETVQDCFGSGILCLCDALFLGCLAMVKMFKMNGTLAVLSLIPMVLLLSMSIIIGKKLTEKWDKRQQAFSDLSDFSQENFSGISVIKAFVKESIELSNFKKLNVANEKANIAHVKASTLFNIMVSFFAESVICVILGYGGFLVYKGTFDAGQLVEYIGYFTSVIWPIMAVSELIDMVSRGIASLKRVSVLLDSEPDVRDGNDVIEMGEIKGNIEFRDLTFRYPGAEYDSLKNVSFTINAGENVGIFGRTGSGKTTLSDLILRTYNVDDGCIFIDGVDINKIPLKTMRGACAYVPQDNFLFSETIGSNIAFALEDYDQEKVEEAAKLAAVNDNIEEFTEKYMTVLGERGVTVSGGQKQRISIARALIKNAPILILDDSVSAVDTGTEQRLISNISSLRKGITTLLIAHRISTIENMDKIVFLDDGMLVACGSHTELMETCPKYRHAVELQQLEEAERSYNA